LTQDDDPWDLPSSASRSESLASEDDRDAPKFRRRYLAPAGNQAHESDEDAWEEEEEYEEEEQEPTAAYEARPRDYRIGAEDRVPQ
jgi:hypothetical protein